MRHLTSSLFIVTCLMPQPAVAYDWSFFPLMPENKCIAGCDTENAARADQRTRMKAAFDKVTPELDKIIAWMAGQGFTKPHFPANGPDGTSLVTIVDLTASESGVIRGLYDGAYADYAPDRGMAINAAEMPVYTDPTKANAALAEETRDTLAHETYHAVQEAADTIDGPLWVIEGTAEFVGNTWAKRGTQRPFSYALALDKPLSEYDRSHFFHMLGSDFGQSSKPTSYLPKFEDSYDDDGIKWLDAFLTGEGKEFWEYFPDFIARHGKDSGAFEHSAANRGIIPEDDTPRPKVFADTDGERKTSERIEIEAIAATYLDISPKFEGDFGSLDDEARVYVNRISVEDASDAAALSLVVRDEVKSSDPFYEPVFAVAGEMKTPFNTRVVNISNEPTSSGLNSAVVTLSTTRVTFGLPACITGDTLVGIIQSASLPRDEIIEAFQVDGVELRVNGSGKLSEDLYFTPTRQSGKAEIVATLPTLDGGKTTVTIADTEIRPEGCMIQMRVGEASITWDGKGRFTEFKQAGGSEALYMRDDDFAVFVDGGFQPLPAMAKSIMLNAFKGRFAGGSLDGIIAGMDSMPDVHGIDRPASIPNFNVDGAALAQLMDEMPAILVDGNAPGLKRDWGMHLMPETFVNRFSWRNLRGAPDRSTKTRAACPAFADKSDGPCSSISFSKDGVQGTVVYSDDGWPLTVTMAGEAMEFETGYFDMRSPPGW